MLEIILIVASILVLIGADQLFKHLVVSNMSYLETRPAIEGLLNWHYTLNDGASFSILRGAKWFFIIGTTLLIAAIVIIMIKRIYNHKIGYIASVLIISGGIGNLIDRIRIGSVIDYIDISPIFTFPIFNFADCCITVGGVLLCVYILFLHEEKKTAESEQSTEENA